MKKITDHLIFKLALGVILGIIIGMQSSEGVMKFIVSIKYILGQIIFFCVPLIILAFISPSIVKLQTNASKMLGTTVLIAYVSSVGAATFATLSGYSIIPHLNIISEAETLKNLPEVAFELNIPPIMSVMSALVLSFLIGLSVIWAKSETFERLLDDFQNMMLQVVNEVVIPILPFFIAATFSTLSYNGSITKQLPIFLKVIVLVLIGHLIWLTLLYGLGGLISKKNPFEVLKNYGPAYLTAVGTMSSAATLPVALSCARKSKILDKKIVDFAIPLGSTVHLCGSVLTETFFIMVVSKVLYGTLPTISTMITFIILLGIFAVGAPGVPGGTVMASLGIVKSIIGFDPSGIGLLLAIFAIQDSFGTACNVTGDGAIALMLTGLYKED
ncbi:dicarboxylate/amino acid:cation symporter [Inediibacterium massiliense]|uniref:dicarboxylate/amino acid:cation symporter n=1 Tax=Inediibacterium massiliense TaxID=1658111 RepID=UPI0006B646E0|nr:dicarboxylate/amino acid:cation symporter [Inediibacterium massiliense]